MRHDKNPTPESLARLHSESHKRECQRLVLKTDVMLVAAEESLHDLAPALRHTGERRDCFDLAERIDAVRDTLRRLALEWSLDDAKD